VPIPWEATAPAYGFSPTGASWLPQPPEWAVLARDVEAGDPLSTLSLYKTLLVERRSHALGTGSLEWIDAAEPGILAFRNGDVTVVANQGAEPAALPEGRVLLASEPLSGHTLPSDTTVWLTAD